MQTLLPPFTVLRDLDKSVPFLFFMVEQYQERQGKDVRNLTTAEKFRTVYLPPFVFFLIDLAHGKLPYIFSLELPDILSHK